ncbi:MAG: hypothetical protein IKA54_05385 [Clostridia bacterium]|nr:hypothetical protein [Clostridia bacterium]
MNDIQIVVTFLQNYSLDVVILSAIITLITNLVKKVLPQKLNNFKGYLPFLFGIIFYAIYSFLLSQNLSVFEIFSRGIHSGGIATLIYAFYKHILKSKGNVTVAISDVLKGILSSGSISGVSKIISNLFKTQIPEDEMCVKIEEILKENTDVSGDVLTAVAKLITKTLSQKK